MSIGKTTWEEIKKKLLDISSYDIFFDKDYFKLYLDKNSKFDFFFYENEKNFFFLPFILRKLPYNKNFYDFESAYGYSGIISSSDNINFLSMAWKNFENYAKFNNLVCGFIRSNPFLENQNFFLKNKNINFIKEKKIVFVDLNKNIDEIYSSFSSDNKNKINKAKKYDINLSSHHNSNDLLEFQKLYLKRMREVKAHETYLYNRDFFNKLSKLENKFIILKVSFNQKVIGMSLILLGQNIAHYYLSASLSDYFKYGPNNILRYYAIKYLKEKNYKILNFGGGLTSSDEDNLLKFKKKFSKDYKYFYIAKYILNSNVYDNEVLYWKKQNMKNDKIKKYDDYFLKYRF